MAPFHIYAWDHALIFLGLVDDIHKKVIKTFATIAKI
jgi:hypothetical protein